MAQKVTKTKKTKISDLKPKKDVKGGAAPRIVRADPDEGGE